MNKLDIDIVRDASNISNVRNLSSWEILLLSACFCSIDTIASEEAVNDKQFPKLYSIIFGEGILKDTITIVLFRAILKLDNIHNPHKFKFYWYTMLQVFGNFLLLIIVSICIGVILAVLSTYMFKKWRFLLHDKGIT